MADNVTVLDFEDTEITYRSTDTAGVHVPWHALGNAAGSASAPVDGTAGLKVNLGADNDVTLAELPDTSAGDLAAITTAVEALATAEAGSGLSVSGSFTAAGGAADDAAASGNPFQMGARFQTTPDAVDDGDIGYLGMTATRALRVTVEDSSGNAVTAATVTGDGAASNTAALFKAGTTRRDGAIGSEVSDDGDNANITTDARDRTWTRNMALDGPAGITTVDSAGDIPITVATGTQAEQELVAAPGSNKQIWITGYDLVTNGDAAVWSFHDEDDAVIAGDYTFAANMGIVRNQSGSFESPLFKLASDKALEISKTGDGVLTGSLQYIIVDVS